jgi:imidazolonepropionase-like amidohydrolase
MEVGLPLLSGGDTGEEDAGFKTHDDMAILVDRGLTPLAALQAATINPAKAINATDSLGTVTKGKLADLVLLDANPLTDITNTTQIRAVVANGRYFDRAALDGLLTEIKNKAKGGTH